MQATNELTENQRKTVAECFEQLEKYLNDNCIRNFDYSLFNNIKLIGKGGSSTVYSANFQEKAYVLKNLNHNLILDKTIKIFINEIKLLDKLSKDNHPNIVKFYGSSKVLENKREKSIDSTPQDYVTLYEKCWSYRPDQRPTLHEILFKLEKLSEETFVKFIINRSYDIVSDGRLDEKKLKEYHYNTAWSMDTSIHKTNQEQYEFFKAKYSNNEDLNEHEKEYLLNIIQKKIDNLKVNNNEGEKRQCEDCKNWIHALQYCEFCIRNYLQNNFCEWTGNNEIDKAIQDAQRGVMGPDLVIEFIPYARLRNVQHRAEGSFADIYNAVWIDGPFVKWNEKERILERLGNHNVILKRLRNSNASTSRWFNEIASNIVRCYGLTKDLTTEDFVLVLDAMDFDLHEYLKKKISAITWKDRYQIIYKISAYDIFLANAVIHGLRPDIIYGMPFEYETLMKQCWDAIPENRPDARTIYKKIYALLKTFSDNKADNNINSVMSNISTQTESSNIEYLSTTPQYLSSGPKNWLKDNQENFSPELENLKEKKKKFSSGPKNWVPNLYFFANSSEAKNFTKGYEESGEYIIRISNIFQKDYNNNYISFYFIYNKTLGYLKTKEEFDDIKASKNDKDNQLVEQDTIDLEFVKVDKKDSDNSLGTQNTDEYIVLPKETLSNQQKVNEDFNGTNKMIRIVDLSYLIFAKLHNECFSERDINEEINKYIVKNNEIPSNVFAWLSDNKQQNKNDTVSLVNNTTQPYDIATNNNIEFGALYSSKRKHNQQNKNDTIILVDNTIQPYDIATNDNIDVAEIINFKDTNYAEQSTDVDLMTTNLEASTNYEHFAPLIDIFLNLGEDIVTIYQKAEHNRRLCNFLTKRVNLAVGAIKDLEIRKQNNMKFFVEPSNLQLIKDFLNCMLDIRTFMTDVSQLGSFVTFNSANIIQKYIDLSNRFDGYLMDLSNRFDGYFMDLSNRFDGDLNYMMQQSDKNAIHRGSPYVEPSKNFNLTQNNDSLELKHEIKFLLEDLKEMKKFMRDMSDGNNTFTDIVRIRELINRFQREQRKGTEITIEPANLLKSDDYEPKYESEPRGKTIHCRWNNTFLLEYAFKEIPPIIDKQTEKEIGQQVAILKELNNSGHIIKFYGIAKSSDGSQYYFVTEWMENGTLQEYYKKFKLSWTQKFEFAIDICRGIAFLNAVEILHHDIRGANILISGNHKPKIANFGLSRKFGDITRNIQVTFENVRYMAPEKLENALLWEIAEEKAPYTNEGIDLQTIRYRVVKEKYPLSHDPDFRPTISKIFTILFDYHHKDEKRPPPSVDEFGTEFVIDDFMTVDAAIKEHRKPDGNKRKAWDCFNQFAEQGDIDAKYWVGYYLYHSVLPEHKDNRQENLQRAAKLFKETADCGKVEAQLRYGFCLWQGDGVSVDWDEAMRYLKLAADNGNPTAMYNVGNAYWIGKGVQKDQEIGSKYLKMAAMKNQHNAISGNVPKIEPHYIIHDSDKNQRKVESNDSTRVMR
ncbi:15453_t:CDS:10 [Cetraspora pellucida]|uniref:15453_t:CDS:1 n=1 Tax=Cetraspora pellucida TaxID=1433469 RepID=A0A9N8VR24_9GLOM|nr:15453_t:CDS:10 [Cetraspora pellucida]